MTDEQEQLQVQLAGCLAAAEGATNNPAVRGDYGWSVAYQRVLSLRQNLDKLTDRAELRGAIARAWCTDRNRHKEMDANLAEDIVSEICDLVQQGER
jgi:hypothetical protein